MSTRNELFEEQLAYREFLREEEWKSQQQEALIQAVAATLPAYGENANWRGGVELGEEVILANVSEWEKKAAEAATQAEEYAQSALKAESRGDMTVASILWGDSWSFDRQAQNYSAEAARYGEMLKPPDTAPKPKITSPGRERAAATMTTPTATMGNGSSPAMTETTAATPTGGSNMRGSSNVPNNIMEAETTEKTDLAMTSEQEPIADFTMVYTAAQEAYQAYQEELKTFNREYGWRRHPEKTSGYETALAELHNLEGEYLAALNQMMNSADGGAFTFDAVAVSLATDRESLQFQAEQKRQEMQAYYEASGGKPDPEVLYWYLKDIAQMEAILAKEPEKPEEKMGFGERLKYMGVSAGTGMAADYVQTVATGAQLLGEAVTSEGYLSQAEITMNQLIAERDAYLKGGIPADNTLVVQLEEAISQLQDEINYIQSGQWDAANEATWQELQEKSHELNQMSESAQKKAEEDLGTVGSFLVNMGIAGCEMLADAAVGAVAGPQAVIVNRAVRDFGSGAYEAAQSGESAVIQAEYGVITAIVGYLVDKLDSNKKDYEDIVRSFSRGMAGQLKTNSSIIETICSLSLHSLGVALGSLARGIVDPLLDGLNKGEIHKEDIQDAWNDSWDDFVVTFSKNTVTHK